jgi:hypothetical protein
MTQIPTAPASICILAKQTFVPHVGEAFSEQARMVPGPDVFHDSKSTVRQGYPAAI